jgi:hypothetical protein
MARATTYGCIDMMYDHDGISTTDDIEVPDWRKPLFETGLCMQQLEQVSLEWRWYRLQRYKQR